MGPDESALPTADAALQGSPRELELLSAPDCCSLPSQEGLGSSCHNKTAAGSPRDTQDSCHAKLVLLESHLAGKGCSVLR